jgi:hypothetical protein
MRVFPPIHWVKMSANKKKRNQKRKDFLKWKELSAIAKYILLLQQLIHKLYKNSDTLNTYRYI